MLATPSAFPEYQNSILTKTQTNKQTKHITSSSSVNNVVEFVENSTKNKYGGFCLRFFYLLVVAALGEELRSRESPGEEG